MYVGLLDLTNKNIVYTVKFQCQINSSKSFFSMNMSYAIFGT